MRLCNRAKLGAARGLDYLGKPPNISEGASRERDMRNI
jgi:hypothetical protein